jgi:hypothetical protein
MKRTATVLLATLTACTPIDSMGAQASNPCSLLTTAEAQRAFPGAKPGRPEGDRDLEKLGFFQCVWSHPSGTLMVLTEAGDAEGAPREEAEGMIDTFVDPLRNDARRHVRYERLPGVGDEAVAIVEREDKTKGFRISGAILVVRRGRRQATVLSSDLGRRDRAEALRVLSDLGKAIAIRLR